MPGFRGASLAPAIPCGPPAHPTASDPGVDGQRYNALGDYQTRGFDDGLSESSDTAGSRPIRIIPGSNPQMGMASCAPCLRSLPVLADDRAGSHTVLALLAGDSPIASRPRDDTIGACAAT